MGQIAWGAWKTLVDNQLVGAVPTISSPLNLDQKAACEVSVTAVYTKGGGTIAAGLKVYLLRDIDGINYEGAADGPWGFEMPYTNSEGATHRRAFAVDPSQVGKCKIHLEYSGGAGTSVAATVRYRTATLC